MSSPANEAGFGNIAVRPKGALSGAGGAGAAEGRSTAASEQTRMACYRTATDSHAISAEKSCSGAGPPPEAPARPVDAAQIHNIGTVGVRRAWDGGRKLTTRVHYYQTPSSKILSGIL